MDDKDRSSYDDKVTPLFRDADYSPDSREKTQEDLMAAQESDTEYASEPVVTEDSRVNVARGEEDHTVDRGIGWLAFVLSVIGLFFLPVVMGTAGVIIGFVALRQGAKTIGGWAIAIGIVSLILRLFAGPFV